jgi:hypothetical protein
MALQRFQNSVKPGPQIERARQRLADLQKRGEIDDLAAPLVVGPMHSTNL